MRPFLLLLLLSTPMAAQSFSLIPQRSVADNSAWVFVYDLDHSGTAQPITIDVSITTPSASGIRVRILDRDEKVVAGAQDEAMGVKVGGGTADAQLVTFARTGVHPIVVIVQTAQPGASAFTGRVDVDAGGLTAVGSNQDFRVTKGLFIPFGL